MASLNRVQLIGRLGADPEVRTTSSGQPVGELRLATSESFTDRDGNRQERTEWHSVIVWGRTAEQASQYLRKGRLVFVDGRLQTRSWDDPQSGQKRYRTEVVAHGVQFLDRGDKAGQEARGGPQEARGGTGGGGGWQGTPKGTSGHGGGTQEADDDSIPF